MPTEFHLFRAKFVRPAQTSFLHDSLTPADLFVAALMQRPSAQFRRDYTWHIGNVHFFDANSGYFAVGRNTPTSIPTLDPTTGDFVELPGDMSPYTFVVFDVRIGLVAVQRNGDLAQTTEEIADKIERLFQITDAVQANDVDVQIDAIPNPQDFISQLKAAYAIKRFTASFKGPNPFDADEYFQKPLSIYLNSAGGAHGVATIEGTSLDADVVSSVARSTAATGNSATARVQSAPGERSMRITMSGDPVKLPYEDASPNPQGVLADAQAAYSKVRHE